MRVSLYYGWQNRYDPKIRQNIIWLPYLQSAIFINHNTLILHKFAYPVTQKHVRLPIKPCIIKQDKQHIIVTLGNQIRLYNNELVYIRCISNVIGNNIDGVSISGCGGQLVVLS